MLGHVSWQHQPGLRVQIQLGQPRPGGTNCVLCSMHACVHAHVMARTGLGIPGARPAGLCLLFEGPAPHCMPAVARLACRATAPLAAAPLAALGWQVGAARPSEIGDA